MLELRDVRRSYGPVDAVAGVSLTVVPGELLVIAGPSGSGKTTLLQLLGALDRPTAGAVVLDGRDLSEMGEGELARVRRETLGFVFQQFNLIPTLNALQNVEAALAPAGGALRPRAEELLQRVGLGDRLTHLPSQLSGGEQQRVAIARALANRPRVLLADEPTGNLDSATGDEIVGLLRSLVDDGLALVLVTHDPAIAAAGDRIVRMRDGRLSEGETVRLEYLVVIGRADGAGYRASVPDLPGCEVTAATRDEAERAIHDAIGEHLDELAARGEPVPPPSARAQLLRVASSSSVS
jgi:putative ABC transport system ATP-binding protein